MQERGTWRANPHPVGLRSHQGHQRLLELSTFPPAAETPGDDGSRHAVLMLAAAASPGNLLEMHILRHHILGKGPAICGLMCALWRIRIQALLTCSRVCVWGMESEFSSLADLLSLPPLPGGLAQD